MNNVIIAALIGLSSTFTVFIMRDVVVARKNEINQLRRVFLQNQLEYVYCPLAHQIQRYITATDIEQQIAVRDSIYTILNKYSYLMPKQTESMMYLLFENTPLASELINREFFIEFDRIRDRYYKLYYVG